MNKTAADAIINAYTRKIFGYALGKTASIAEAEELASRITLDAYVSLLRADEIANANAYIRRVAQNVYARFVDEAVRGRHLPLDGAIAAETIDFTLAVQDSDEYARLRREIARLGRTQREIIIAHYYDRLKLADIAARLSIPLGTVKWHLHDAKKSLKEGINMARETGILGIKPVKFHSMGHSGSPGKLGDTSYFLQKTFTQNVAFAAYHEPRTIVEIADELGVSPVFVEDEVTYLEEYGFMESLPASKYRTNIYITENKADIMNAEHALDMKYAEIIRQQYVPLVFDALASWDKTAVYIPGGDENLLRWSGLVYAMCHNLISSDESYDATQKFMIKRKDGGEYIAFAQLSDGEQWKLRNYDPQKYGFCGDMRRNGSKYPISAWQIDTYYDGRTGTWRDFLNSDSDWLYEAMTGKIAKDEVSAEKYKRLYDKGLLLATDSGDEVNVIVIRVEKDEIDYAPYARLPFPLPPIPDDLRAKACELDEEIVKLYKPLYPQHMQPLVQSFNRNNFSSPGMAMRVVELCLNSGQLTLPPAHRKSGIVHLTFADLLP